MGPVLNIKEMGALYLSHGERSEVLFTFPVENSGVNPRGGDGGRGFRELQEQTVSVIIL